MKTYYEMTESVLEKARTEVLKQERRRRNGVFIAASGICAVLLLTVIGAGLKQFSAGAPTLPGEQPGISMDATKESQTAETQAQVKITYLSNVVGQTTEKPMTVGVALPLNGMIRIRDTRGFSEEERDKAREEEVAAARAFELPGETCFTKWEYPGAIVTIVNNGAITLDFSDCTVKNVEVETTGVGMVGRSAIGNAPNPENGKIYWPNVRKASFDWGISSDAVFEIQKDPTIPLESIRDTVTITVDYTDGTAETLVFDITVNEEGYIFVTQRGTPAEAV